MFIKDVCNHWIIPVFQCSGAFFNMESIVEPVYSYDGHWPRSSPKYWTTHIALLHLYMPMQCMHIECLV